MSRKYKHPPVGQKRFMAACQHTSVYQAANLLSNPLGRGPKTEDSQGDDVRVFKTGSLKSTKIPTSANGRKTH